jgi:hypothetical protein
MLAETGIRHALVGLLGANACWTLPRTMEQILVRPGPTCGSRRWPT